MDDASTPRSSRTAHEDLRFIRQTLAAAGHLSAVPGKGLVVVGLIGLLTVWLDRIVQLGSRTLWERLPIDDDFSGVVVLLWMWKALWLGSLLISFAIGREAMRRKAKRMGQTFLTPVLRKALWGYSAAMALGAILTLGLITTGRSDLLPEVWLGCYGVALVAAGSYSVSPVRWMGTCFLALAATAALTPASYGPALLALGFGWVHIAFGAYIAWRHDG